MSGSNKKNYGYFKPDTEELKDEIIDKFEEEEPFYYATTNTGGQGASAPGGGDKK